MSNSEPGSALFRDPVRLLPHVLFIKVEQVHHGETKHGCFSRSVRCLPAQVELNTPVPVSEHVEEWLEHLSTAMRSTLSGLLKECLRGQLDYERFPSQVNEARSAVGSKGRIRSRIMLDGWRIDVKQRLLDSANPERHQEFGRSP